VCPSPPSLSRRLTDSSLCPASLGFPRLLFLDLKVSLSGSTRAYVCENESVRDPRPELGKVDRAPWLPFPPYVA